MSILLAFAATVAAATPAPQASIPFFSTATSPDWRADGDKGLWLRANMPQWFYVTLNGPCSRLAAATTLGFHSSPNDEFDRFSTIVAEGELCPVQSVVKSDAPPKLQRKG